MPEFNESQHHLNSVDDHYDAIVSVSAVDRILQSAFKFSLARIFCCTRQLDKRRKILFEY